MKHYRLVAAVILLISILAGCANTNTSSRIEQDDMALLEPVSRNKGDLVISVDPRIELLVSVQLESNYFRLNNQDSKYGKEMDSFFQPYKSHSAVRSFQTISKTSFNYDAPPTAALYFDVPLGMKQHTAFTTYLTQRGGGEKKLDAFFNSLQNFAVQSNFESFYTTHKELYQDMVDKVYDNLGNMDLVNDLEEYYRVQKDEYHIILSPLLHSGGYGPQIETSEGKTKVYGILGPDAMDEQGIPQFSTDFIKYLVWHEFSHSFVNPLTEKYREEVNRYDSLLAPISGKMQAMAYGNWDTCVNEHIVRAVTSRLAALKDGEDVGLTALKQEKAQGFAYIEALSKKLEEFEQNPGKWSSFEAFYPELIGVFKELSESNLGEDFYTVKFEGPINAAFMDMKKVVLIVPTHEAGAGMNEKIQQYVKLIRDKFFKDCKVFTDEQALQEDLSDRMIVAYGTLQGNSWLLKYSDGFPFMVTENRITADKEYEGNDMRFISALPNPANSDNALLVYTAQKAEDILEINNLFHGPTDYVLFRGSEDVILEGNYLKTEQGWSFGETE